MKQVGGACPCQGIRPTGKGTPGQEARVFLAFNVLLPLDKGKKCIYALRESSKAWQVIWVFPDAVSNSDVLLPVLLLTHSLFHARTSATMSGRQTRSKTKYDQPAAAAPKAGSTSKRKPDSSGKGDKLARKKNKMQELSLLRWSRRL